MLFLYIVPKESYYLELNTNSNDSLIDGGSQTFTQF